MSQLLTGTEHILIDVMSCVVSRSIVDIPALHLCLVGTAAEVAGYGCRYGVVECGVPQRGTLSHFLVT